MKTIAILVIFSLALSVSMETIHEVKMIEKNKGEYDCSHGKAAPGKTVSVQ